MIGSGSVNLTKIMNIGGGGAASKIKLIQLGLILDTKVEMQADCVWLQNLEKVDLANKRANIWEQEWNKEKANNQDKDKEQDWALDKASLEKVKAKVCMASDKLVKV